MLPKSRLLERSRHFRGLDLSYIPDNSEVALSRKGHAILFSQIPFSGQFFKFHWIGLGVSNNARTSTQPSNFNCRKGRSIHNRTPSDITLALIQTAVVTRSVLLRRPPRCFYLPR